MRRVLALLAAVWALAPLPSRAEFVDASAGAGLYGDQPSWGAQAADLDADGDLDIVNPHHYLSVQIFTNAGDGTFSTTGIPPIMVNVQDRHGILWVDLDGDEVLDGVVSHGGDGGCGCSDYGNELFQGLGGGMFQSVPGGGGMADSVGRGRAFSAADIDGDGDLDLYHGKAPLAASPNSLYRNDGSLAFVDVAADWGVANVSGTTGALFADYDDDGDPDLLLGGEEFVRPTTLLRNDDSTFTDVTSGLLGTVPVIAGGDWGDYDGDGDLDLAVCEGREGVYDSWGVDGRDYWFFSSHRFGDDGVDAFEMESLGANPIAIFQYLGAFQADKFFLGPSGVHPGSPIITLSDAYVGAPTFTPGVDHGLYCWRESPGGAWQIRSSAPPDTYGNFSGFIYTSGGVSNPGASNLEQLTIPPGQARVYRNDGGSGFTEVSATLGLTASANPRAVVWTDFDNDGDLDLHQANKGTTEIGNEADVLWRNDGATFAPLTGAGWVPGDTDHLADGGVWGDLDRDGDLDLVLQEGAGPLFFSSLAPTTLYRNDGPAGHWLQVTLGETAAGGTPVGARVTAWAGSTRVHRRVQANSWRGFQRPLDLHFGLGAATMVDSLVVEWPGGGVEVLGPIPADRSLHLAEGQPTAAWPVVVAGSPPVGAIEPQPARGPQAVQLQLPSAGHLRVEVFDVAGRRVRTLRDGWSGPGPLRVTWNGLDDRGRPVPAGVYFLRGSGALSFQRKAVRLR